MNISQKNNEALKNPWVLGMLLFLVVFLTANAIFIYQAFSNPPSLVDAQFYEHGENYEQDQKLLKEQEALGWTGIIMVPVHTRVHQTQSYQVVIQGKNAVAIELDSVKLKAYRPSDAKADFVVDMHKVKPGVYAADTSFNLPGTWDINIEAMQDDQRFLVHKRISIKP